MAVEVLTARRRRSWRLVMPQQEATAGWAPTWPLRAALLLTLPAATRARCQAPSVRPATLFVQQWVGVVLLVLAASSTHSYIPRLPIMCNHMGN